MTEEEQKNICNVCGGIGQISFFQGVSRFLLTTEECSECAGTGYQIDSIKDQSEDSNSHCKKQKKKDVK